MKYTNKKCKHKCANYELHTIGEALSRAKTVVCSSCKKTVSVQFDENKEPLVLSPYTMVEDKAICCKCLGE